MNCVHGVRLGTLLGVGLLGLVPAAAQEVTPVIEGTVEVREVGVVANLPRALRGRSADQLRHDLIILEAGVERAPVSVGSLAGAGVDSYGRVLVIFDRERCSDEILGAAAAALGDQAARLVALGPVEVAELTGALESIAEPTRSSTALAGTLARVARSQCGPAPDEARLGRIAIEASTLDCPATACLLLWVGPGWGARPGDGVVPASSSVAEPLARGLVAGGWLFVAAPIVEDAEKEPRPKVPDAESRPGSDRHTFGVNVLRRPGGKPVSAEDYSRFVDLWLTPLRRLVAASAGELVDRADQLPTTLDALAARSVLWYRTDRRSDGGAPRLEIRETGADARKFKAPEWAPERGH